MEIALNAGFKEGSWKWWLVPIILALGRQAHLYSKEEGRREERKGVLEGRRGRRVGGRDGERQKEGKEGRQGEKEEGREGRGER